MRRRHPGGRTCAEIAFGFMAMMGLLFIVVAGLGYLAFT